MRTATSSVLARPSAFWFISSGSNAPAARSRGLRSTQFVWQMLHESYRLINERFLHGLNREVLGLYGEMENLSIMRRRNEAVWQDDGMIFVFIGRTNNGNHMRVWYFDGARIR